MSVAVEFEDKIGFIINMMVANKDGRLLVKTDGNVEVLDLGRAPLDQWQKWVGGYIERVNINVREGNLRRSIWFIVDEEGLIKGRSPNFNATDILRLGGPIRQSICGDVVICWGKGRLS